MGGYVVAHWPHSRREYPLTTASKLAGRRPGSVTFACTTKLCCMGTAPTALIAIASPALTTSQHTGLAHASKRRKHAALSGIHALLNETCVHGRAGRVHGVFSDGMQGSEGERVGGVKRNGVAKAIKQGDMRYMASLLRCRVTEHVKCRFGVRC
jgi:hypothetical protein